MRSNRPIGRNLKMTVFFIAMTLIQAGQSSNLITDLIRFAQGKSTDDNEFSSSYTRDLLFLSYLLPAITLAITMTITWAEEDLALPDNSNKHCESKKIAKLQQLEIDTDHRDHNHRHEEHHEHGHGHGGHSNCQQLSEFLIIGSTFGALSYTGIFMLLKNRVNPIVDHLLSVAAGGIAMWGNFKLHGHHIHADKGIFALSNEIPNSKKPHALYMACFILLGHFFQCWAAGSSLINIFSIPNPTVKVILECVISTLLAIPVTIFEGHTEMRSTLLEFSNAPEYKSTARITKLINALMALDHGTIPVVGTINFSEICYKAATNKDLVNILSLPARISMIIAFTIAFVYPNGRGFYSTTLPSLDKAPRYLTDLFRSQPKDEEKGLLQAITPADSFVATK